MKDAVMSVRDTSENRLASMASYRYVASDGSCAYKNHKNALIGAEVTGYVDVASGERNTIAALSDRTLSITFKVIDSFFSYTGGIYRDETRASFPNHALTAVAYTPEYVLVKNSWGTAWGDKGYIKVARNYDGCAFHTYVGYAVVKDSGTKDTTKPDEPTDYVPSEPEPECEDNFSG